MILLGEVMQNKLKKIISTTKNIIANQGLKEVSAGLIAKEGKFSKASIFYYFENIDLLLDEVLDDAIKEIGYILGSNYKDFENFSDYLYKSVNYLIDDKEKLLNLKVIFIFAHEKYYFYDSKNVIKNFFVENIRTRLFNSLEYFNCDISLEDESRYLLSLIMTSFYGLGLLLSLNEQIYILKNNWKLQCKLIDLYLK